MNIRQIEEKINKHDKLLGAMIEQSKAQSDFNTNAANDISSLIKLNQELIARVEKLERRMKL